MKPSLLAIPSGRIAAVYFAYFGGLGVLLPFWAPYLAERGFSAVEIGGLMAVLMGTKLIGPPLVGWLADHTGHSMRWVQAAATLAVVLFGFVWGVDNFTGMALVMLAFGMAWNGMLPQLDVVTLNHLGTQSHLYAPLRAWGSIGFIVAAIAIGPMVDWFGLAVVPVLIWLALTMLWLITLTLPDATTPLPQDAAASFWQVFAQPVVPLFLLASFLINAAHGTYYAFYSIHLSEHGYAQWLIGALWALGVAAEVVLFLLMPWLLARFGAWGLFMTASVLTALRFLLIGLLPNSFTLVLLAQLMHAASFGITHAVAIGFIHRYFVGRNQSRGQAILSSVSYGAGGAAGLYAAGVLWSWYGAEVAFAVMAGLGLMAGMLLLGQARAMALVSRIDHTGG
ncbi:MAG TPA: MFS transporter [Halothiobacillus sp.]|nr:MFS transporter [Halothiobacillus sp.]